MRLLIFFLIINFNSSLASDDRWDNLLFRNIKELGKYDISSGTGFFISDNIVVTNHHVIQNCYNISIRGAVDPSPVSLYAISPETDIALLYSEENPNYLPSIRSNMHSIKKDDIAYVIGYPLDRGNTGLYDVVDVKIHNFDYYNYSKPIDFSVKTINHGNSGGPLIDESGNIIGIVSSKKTEFLGGKPISEEGSAIRIEILESILKNLKIPYYKNPSEKKALSPSVIAKDYIVNINCIAKSF